MRQELNIMGRSAKARFYKDHVYSAFKLNVVGVCWFVTTEKKKKDKEDFLFRKVNGRVKWRKKKDS